jgi:hypothetical protein
MELDFKEQFLKDTNEDDMDDDDDHSSCSSSSSSHSSVNIIAGQQSRP